jgi:hypothetical protein
VASPPNANATGCASSRLRQPQHRVPERCGGDEKPQNRRQAGRGDVADQLPNSRIEAAPAQNASGPSVEHEFAGDGRQQPVRD